MVPPLNKAMGKDAPIQGAYRPATWCQLWASSGNFWLSVPDRATFICSLPALLLA